jgi:microcompartment protein CcmK/EutM
MRIAKIIGDVTLSRSLPEFVGGTLRVAVALTKDELPEHELGSGHGSLIALSESAEAACPFRPINKPIDAYNAAILETINLK